VVAPLALETMCFCYQKSKTSVACGKHIVLVDRYHTLGLYGLNKMIWFSTMKDGMLVKSTKLFRMPYLIMVRRLGIDV
jgi:hypothetical protein